MRKILLSILTIGFVAIVAIGATVAYFSATSTVLENTFASGNVTLGEVWNLPLTFGNLIPGIEQSRDAAIKYTGTTPADIYIGMANQSGYAWYDPSTNISKMEFAIWSAEDGIWLVNWSPVKNILADWIKVASNVNPNTWRHYTVKVRVYPDVGEEAEGQTNVSKLIIHAVQAGAPVQLTGAPWQQ